MTIEVYTDADSVVREAAALVAGQGSDWKSRFIRHGGQRRSHTLAHAP
jgi:hypothetical protein